jgi:hypothetical protein
MDNQTDIYPATVIRSRYGGVYEGGRWAALDCSHDEVPEGAISDWRALAEESLPEVRTVVQ